MSEMLEEFVTPLEPSAENIFNIAVTTASAPIDLTGANYTGLKAAIDAGRMLTLLGGGDVWYRWDDATGTVSETSTAASTPANQGILLPTGAERSGRPPRGTTFLIVKAPVACTLWLWVSSESLGSQMKSS